MARSVKAAPKPSPMKTKQLKTTAGKHKPATALSCPIPSRAPSNRKYESQARQERLWSLRDQAARVAMAELQFKEANAMVFVANFECEEVKKQMAEMETKHDEALKARVAQHQEETKNQEEWNLLHQHQLQKKVDELSAALVRERGQLKKERQMKSSLVLGRGGRFR